MIKILFLLIALTKHRTPFYMRMNSDNKTFNINNAIQNNLSGYDERYSINESELYTINKHFNKYNLLKTLEDKLKLIDDSMHAFNITQGGLFKDWDDVK